MKITKKKVKEIVKREFDKYMKDKSLEVSMTSSLENPVIKFEFFKKVRN